MLALLGCLLGILVCFVFVDKWRNRRRWDLLNKVPGPTPWPLLGNVSELGLFSAASKLRNPITIFLQARLGLGLIFQKEKFYLLWIGRRPIIFLTAPETVEPLLTSNTSLEKGDLYKLTKPWLGEGLVTSVGDKWRRHRKMLTPTFHFRILDDFLTVMNEQAAIFVQKLGEASKQREWLDVFHFATLCTLDIICETAMGCSIGAQHKESDYGQAIKKAAHSVMIRGPKPWLHNNFIYYLTQEGKEYKKSVAVLHDFTYQVIADKVRMKDNSKGTPDDGDQGGETNGKKRLAFLDMLLDNDLTTQELREQVDTFMFAGHDTTSSALSWLIYVLGVYPEVQERVFQEIEESFVGDKDRHVTQEDMRNLKYTDCVIKEAQRVYPPVPGVSRRLAEDTEIGGFLIPEGTECSVAIYSLHHNAEIYPNPDVFDPDRFSPENSAGRHPFAFIPFSAGPRNCIGQRFAQMELRVLLCYVLRHFRIRSLDPRDRVILVPEIVLRSEHPLRIQLLPRL